jgi:hypothetical protein
MSLTVKDDWRLAPVRVFLHASEADRAAARLRRLRRLGENHDGEGASAPDVDSVDEAIAFLNRASLTMRCVPTLSEEGKAVIEVHVREAGKFADITFMGPEHGDVVRCYVRKGREPSVALEGHLDDAGVRSLIEDAAGVLYD